MEIEEFKKLCLDNKTKKEKEISRHQILIKEQDVYGNAYKPKGWLNKKCPNCGEKLIKTYLNQSKFILKCKKCEYEYAGRDNDFLKW